MSRTSNFMLMAVLALVASACTSPPQAQTETPEVLPFTLAEDAPWIEVDTELEACLASIETKIDIKSAVAGAIETSDEYPQDAGRDAVTAIDECIGRPEFISHLPRLMDDDIIFYSPKPKLRPCVEQHLAEISADEFGQFLAYLRRGNRRPVIAMHCWLLSRPAPDLGIDLFESQQEDLENFLADNPDAVVGTEGRYTFVSVGTTELRFEIGTGTIAQMRFEFDHVKQDQDTTAFLSSAIQTFTTVQDPQQAKEVAQAFYSNEVETTLHGVTACKHPRQKGEVKLINQNLDCISFYPGLKVDLDVWHP